MTTRMIRLSTVRELTGLSRSTLYDRMAKGTFPAHFRLGARAVAWREADIEAWLNSLEPASVSPVELPAAKEGQ